MTVGATGTPTLGGTGTLFNLGTLVVVANNLGLVTGATITNSGLVDFQGDGDLAWSSGASVPALANTGTVRKSAGSGTSVIDLSVNSTGTVEVDLGTLNLSRTVTQVFGSSLVGGTWNVIAADRRHRDADTSRGYFDQQLDSPAAITLSGQGSSFPALANLGGGTGSFTVMGGRVWRTGGTGFNTTGGTTIGSSTTSIVDSSANE